MNKHTRILTANDVTKKCLQCFARNVLLGYPATHKCPMKKHIPCLFDNLSFIPFDPLSEALHYKSA